MKKVKSDTEIYICNLFAQNKSASEIREMLKYDHKTSLCLPTIYNIAKKNSAGIEKIRAAMFEKNLKVSIPIASETVRLEREEALFNLSQNLQKNTEKISYGLSCLKEAREESKTRETAGANILQLNQFNYLTDSELLEKKKKLEESIIELNKKGECYAKEQGVKN